MRKKYLMFVPLVAVTLFLSSGCGARCYNMKNGGSLTRIKSPDGGTMISGQVYAPLEKAYVYIYREGDDLHGPAFATSQATDAQGKFSINLPPGKYYLVARRRGNGSPWGPLKNGDYKSEIIGSFAVKAGENWQTNLVCKAKTDDNELFNLPGTEKTETTLSGTILNSEGQPVKGVRVHVYKYIQMSERPKFVSAATGPDGRFVVYLPKGGTYYICARDSFGGPPKLGDLYGRYDGGAINPSAVVLNNGDRLENIDITVQRVW